MIVFPKNFVWGTATASYQIEGGWLEGGKGLSIWDAFAHTPGKIADGATGDVTCDHLHRWKEDVALMARLGLKAYRFSIAWPRIQPSGRGTPNPVGLRFYSNLIDELLLHDITPWVTLYHWDLPLALQLECDGWLNPKLAELFRDYAAICFENFGSRVKHWITFNEPWVVSILGHGQGIFAPGRTSNSEPYQVAHTILRAHGMAVHEYRSRFKPKHNGVIAMTNNCDWREPRTDAPGDQAAAERAREFFLGWFADPLYRGEYPESMRERVGDRLPQFTPDDRRLIQGSQEFFGLNHYTTMLASAPGSGEALPVTPFGNAGIAEDQDVQLSVDPSWAATDMGWAIVPWGCRKLLQWINKRYNHPDIILTENGCAFPDVLSGDAVDDSRRVTFLDAYLTACHEAILDGVNLRGYFLWSLLDNFEWSSGFSRRFGICYVDYPTGRRIPKSSAYWFSHVTRENQFEPIPNNPHRTQSGAGTND
jgi:beta-galactosidase